MDLAQNGSQRQKLWAEYSHRQVEMLQALRGELSNRRWEIMLDVDDAKALVGELKNLAPEKEVQNVIARLLKKLNAIQEYLARIPEDLIPPF